MTDKEIYNLLRSLSSSDDKVAYAYAMLREERDERLKIAKYDFLKLAGFLAAMVILVYSLFYYLVPNPCQ